MAKNYFEGWTLEQLISWRTAIQEARLTGRITRSVSSAGIYTDFDPGGKINLDGLLDQIQYAISLLDEDETNPYAGRPGITQQVFGD